MVASSSSSFEEAASPFTGTPTIETMRRLYEQVLRAYEGTCAVTGASVPLDLAVQGQTVVAIRPLQLGGALHVSNFLVLGADAGEAFSAGHFTVGPGHELIADLSLLSPELLERFHTSGRLHLPADRAYWPDEAHLAFHRSRIFGLAHRAAAKSLEPPEASS